MIQKILKSGRCPNCGGIAKKIGNVYVCESCKIVFNKFGVSKFAKDIIDYELNFDVFGHPNEENIKNNLN